MAVNRRGWTMLSLYQSDDEPRLATVTEQSAADPRINFA
jgi:hypothetical protein